MTDIKPDTSLYSALEMKLHALAKALNRPCGGLLEERDPFGAMWVPANGHATDFMVRLAQGCEYRIKPKPRELWVAYNRNGSIYKVSGEPLEQEPGTTVVRFAEQPTDGA